MGVAKKNKRVQEAVALAAAAIKEGKLQLPKLGDKRKFGVDTSPKPFGTITRLNETPSHPSVTPGCPTFVERPRAPGRRKGPLTPPKPPLLVNDATYAVEQVISIIKEEDIDDCDEYDPVAIGEFGLQDLAKVFPLHFFILFYLFLDTHYLSPAYSSACLSFRQWWVRMKIIELRCGNYEDQVINLWKHVKGYNEVIKELQAH